MIEGNLASLAKRYPKLAESLRGAQVRLEGLSVETAESGRPYLRIKNMPVESAQDPSGEARRTVAELAVETKLLIIKGAGLGYLWKAAAARRDFDHIVCIEPETALFALMISVSDMRRVFEDERVAIAVGADVHGVVPALKRRYDYGVEAQKLLIVLPRHVVLRHPVMALSESFDVEFDRDFGAAAKVSDRNRATLERFVHPWREHILANLPAMMESGRIADLAGAGKNIPGILVGAGPSLDRTVDDLREAQGRAVIVAVDTAYRTLKAKGITPDFVVAIDATEENTKDFNGIAVGEDPTALVMVPVVHPKIPPLFQQRFVAGYGHPLQRWIETVIGSDFGSLLVSGSVSTIAYDLLRLMQCRPIIMTGVDFAYGATTHSRGSMFHKVAESRFGSAEAASHDRTREATLTRTGWGGSSVKTTEQMFRWAEWFEKELIRDAVPTINSSEGGIRIEGTKELRLAEAIRRHCARSFRIPAPRAFSEEARERLRTAMAEGLPESVLRWEKAVLSPRDYEEALRRICKWMIS